MLDLERNIKISVPLVLEALREMEESRDDDAILCAYVWERQGAREDIDFGEFTRMLIVGQLTAAEILVRVKRQAQLEIKELRGAKWLYNKNLAREFKKIIKNKINE